MVKRVRVVNNIHAFVEGVNRRAASAVMAGANVIGLRAALYTPIDSSTLINSQNRELKVNGYLLTGRVIYTANYAAYVHNAPGTLKGQPRAHFGKTRGGKQFGGGSLTGNYWDPNAKPKFLQLAAEEGRQEVEEAIRREMTL
ncbi:HK97 gp10 family phage protein [Providencia hangzhouensis]